ncbi:response regulator [Ekhidna sp.]|uniref:response regulator n=1 Tax=Ekhidna sp. TaxID=2608089 RepID=UPI003CCBF4A9
METLTAEERAERRAARRAARKAARTEKEYTILYVDDEMPNLRGFKSTFRRLYNVHTALGPHEALEVIKKEKIDLIVTDHRMPHMSGVELLKDVFAFKPEIKRMILSGFIKRADLYETIGDFGIHDFVTKPWDFEDLNNIFQRILTTDADVKDFSKLG